MKSESTTVFLYELDGLALLVPTATNVVYVNQTGGHACLQARVEGYLVPLADRAGGSCDRLDAHFTGPKWGGWCFERLDDETANEIDRILAEGVQRSEIVVDRTKLDRSWEAWVHVQITGPLQALVERAWPREAILTWPNSD